jgi:hypothetical protein
LFIKKLNRISHTVLISTVKIKDYIFRLKKFVDFFIFQLLNKKLKLRKIIRKFGYYFKILDIGGKSIPWIPIKAKIWLDNFLKSNMIVYECGSGISTLYFSTKVKKVFSIEHNKTWYKNIKDELNKRKIINCEYSLIEPEKISTNVSKQVSSDYRSSLTEYSKFSFTNYVKSIDKYQDHYFDFLFIDGRARLGCIKHSIPKIKKGGYLMMDNSDERRYKKIQKFLREYEKLDFFGIAPANPYLKLSKISYWNASAWKIK